MKRASLSHLAGRVFLALMLAGLALGVSAPGRVQADSGVWRATGSMINGHKNHTATLLLNGKVLVVGGISNPSTATPNAELYNPATGTWSSTGSLSTGRIGHTATLLLDGKVLVVGGSNNTGTTLSSAELYDPATGLWSPTGSLSTARSGHTATRLLNGKVLVAGGPEEGDPFTNSFSRSELYDPATGTWSPAAVLARARRGHTATLLQDGKVLVTGGHIVFMGGWDIADATLYDPVNNTWTATDSMASARVGHQATLLPNGKVLVSGGYNEPVELNATELYDPATGHWSPGGDMAVPRLSHTATLLTTGKVLVTGGFMARAELYDPATNLWTGAGSMAMDREGHTATLLPSGKVLIAGGGFGPGAMASAELYQPEGLAIFLPLTMH